MQHVKLGAHINDTCRCNRTIMPLTVYNLGFLSLHQKQSSLLTLWPSYNGLALRFLLSSPSLIAVYRGSYGLQWPNFQSARKHYGGMQGQVATDIIREIFPRF